MDPEEKKVTWQEIVALGVGLVVTVAAALYTTLVEPVAFPLNFIISLALGGAAGFGLHLVLDPRTREDDEEARAERSYQKMLSEIDTIAERTGEAGQRLRLICPEVTVQLESIAAKARMILARYRERARDIAGASATLLFMQRFDKILARYVKVKRGELFLDQVATENEIADVETNVIPMLEAALDRLGHKLDAGEAINTNISRDTLESMLQSLDLIQSLPGELVLTSEKIEQPSETGDAR